MNCSIDYISVRKGFQCKCFFKKDMCVTYHVDHLCFMDALFSYNTVKELNL